jgi:hypothetical protein
MPEPYQEPSWFRWFKIPLVLVGILMAFTLLTLYVLWQPKFAGEHRRRRRRP